MHHLVFSISALLGTDLLSVNGVRLGVLEDVICNKDSGKITYLIVSAGSFQGFPDKLYALHHSFFYLDGGDEALTFDAKLGKEDHPFFLDLPDRYAAASVNNYDTFSRLILPHLSVAGHRSDYD